MAASELILISEFQHHSHIVPVRQSPRTRTSIGTVLDFAPDMAVVIISVVIASEHKRLQLYCALILPRS